MTLSDFLLARIAEDEHDAYHAQGLLGVVMDWHEIERLRERGLTRADARHVHRWSAARVLAECDAKRRIVAWHRLIDGLDTEDNPVLGCGNCIASGAESPYLIAGPCMTVRLLALPYADHEDFREEWRP